MSDKQWITDKMINLGRDGYIAYLKQNEKQRQINSKN